MSTTTTPQLRLNLGSGPVAVPGWVNIDRSPNVWLDRIPGAKRLLRRAGVLNDGHMRSWSREIQRHDIRRLPNTTGSVDAIYSSHALEHLYLEEAQSVLTECSRVLRPGGIIRLALPDATRIAREFVATSDTAEGGREFNARLLAQPTKRPGLLGSLKAATGGHVHYWQPTAPLVEDMLTRAGFEQVSRMKYREGNLPGVSGIETRAESFFLEAICSGE